MEVIDLSPPPFEIEGLGPMVGLTVVHDDFGTDPAEARPDAITG